jgi:uncharacterized protein (DUF3084 family)
MSALVKERPDNGSASVSQTHAKWLQNLERVAKRYRNRLPLAKHLTLAVRQELAEACSADADRPSIQGCVPDVPKTARSGSAKTETMAQRSVELQRPAVNYNEFGEPDQIPF